MLKTKIGKKLAASVTAMAMVASASAASITTLTAHAQMLGEGTFEEGAGLPWHVCENGTGSMAFNIDGGVYSILIKNPGGGQMGLPVPSQRSDYGIWSDISSVLFRIHHKQRYYVCKDR